MPGRKNILPRNLNLIDRYRLMRNIERWGKQSLKFSIERIAVICRRGTISAVACLLEGLGHFKRIFHNLTVILIQTVQIVNEVVDRHPRFDRRGFKQIGQFHDALSLSLGQYIDGRERKILNTRLEKSSSLRAHSRTRHQHMIPGQLSMSDHMKKCYDQIRFPTAVSGKAIITFTEYNWFPYYPRFRRKQ
jgi:hypothetical protein